MRSNISNFYHKDIKLHIFEQTIQHLPFIKTNKREKYHFDLKLQGVSSHLTDLLHQHADVGEPKELLILLANIMSVNPVTYKGK